MSVNLYKFSHKFSSCGQRKFLSIHEKVLRDVPLFKTQSYSYLYLQPQVCSNVRYSAAMEKGQSTQQTTNAACEQINCHVLLLINYQKGTHTISLSQQYNAPGRVVARRVLPLCGKKVILPQSLWAPVAVTHKWKYPFVTCQLMWLLLTR